jgi:Transglutaminase-like superfamily/Domain of unknown function (DUF4129)
MSSEFRRRLLGVHGPCAMDTWISGFAQLAAIWSGLLLAAALVWLPDQPELAATCLLLPLLGRPARRLDPEGQAGAVIDIVLQGASVLLCFLLAMQSTLFFPLLTGLFAVLASQRSRADGTAAACFVLSALSSAGLGATFGGSIGLLIAFPSLCLTATGLLWLQARHTRRKVRIASVQQPEESLLGLRGRALIGCALGLILLLLVPMSFQAADTVQLGYQTYFGGEEEGSFDEFESARRQADQSERRDRDRSNGGESEQERRRRVQRTFPDALAFEGDSSMLPRSQSKRLELRVMQPLAEMRRFHNARPAYLLTTSYDGFGDDGLLPARYDALREYTDGADGAHDGWCQVEPDLGLGTLLEIQMIISTLYEPGTSPQRIVLPRIEPVIAAFKPSLRHRASGMLTVPDNSSPVQQFRFRTRAPHLNALELRRPVFDRSDPRFLRLPTDRVWAPVVKAVREQMQGLDPSESSLRAVLGHFKRNYEYSLAAPSTGVAGLAEFLDHREGYCTYFASSAMLMLRMLNVPCRVVAGYRVTEWDEERQAYVAGDQAGHAWVEVRVLGEGWMSVDPTPAASLETALAKETERLQRAEELGRLAAEKEAELEELAAAALNPDEPSDSNDPDADASEDANAATSAAQGEPDRMHLSLGWIAGIVVVLFLMLIRGLQTARRDGELTTVEARRRAALAWTEIDPVLVEDGSYLRVLKLFKRLGFLPGQQRTPLEFANAKLRRRGDSFRPLLAITRMLYARRYGDRPMTGAAWEYFLRYERAVQESDERDKLSLD